MPSSSSLVTTIVEAGAGTGKTQALAERIVAVALEIYRRSGKFPRLVATTFTERATAELRARVASIAPPELEDFIYDQQLLHISTIHGVLALFLRRGGAAIGIDPDFVIIDSRQETEIAEEVMRGLAAKNGPIFESYKIKDLLEIMKQLADLWRRTGKLKPQFNWEEFCRDEIARIRSEIVRLTECDLSDLTPKTRQQVELIKNLAEIKAEDFIVSFLDEVEDIAKPRLKEGPVKEIISVVFDARDRWRKPCWNKSVNETHDELASLFAAVIPEFAARLDEAKQQAGVLSFDDLEFQSLELIRRAPECGAEFRSLWDFWFVDEYQDTSPLQNKLLTHFFNRPWNAYFVGDPQQSIYLFRGADAQVFSSTRDLIKQEAGQMERLATNYRSHPDLLEFLNQVFDAMKSPVQLLEARGERTGDSRADVIFHSEGISESDLVAHKIFEWKSKGEEFHNMAVLVRTNRHASQIARGLSKFGIPVYLHTSGGFYDRREITDAMCFLTLLVNPSDDHAFVTVARSPWVGIPDDVLAQWAEVRGDQSFLQWLSQNPVDARKFPSIAKMMGLVARAFQEPLSAVFEETLTAFSLFDFCLVGDSTGRREANLRKLIMNLRTAEGKSDFNANRFAQAVWQEYDGESDESDAASFVEPLRVNILTIHKSKGLKFGNVIVPFCGEAERLQQSIVEVAPDGRFAVQVPSNETEARVTPLSLQFLRDERKEKEIAESQRVFYVAITRAAERLCLISKEQPDKASWLGQTSLNWKDDIPGTFRLEFFAQPPSVEPFLEKAAPDQSEVVLKTRPTSKTREYTVSELIKSKRPLHLEAVQRGEAVHFLFEEMQRNPAILFNDLLSIVQKKYSINLAQHSENIKRTLDLEMPPLRSLMRDGSAEWPFMIKRGDTVLQGQIDLWGTVNGITWIVDYKSASQWSPELIKNARQQLELYSIAVRKLGFKNIKLAIVAPLLGQAQVVTAEEPRPDLADLRPPIEAPN